MKRKYTLILGAILIVGVYLNAVDPTDEIDVPIVIDLTNTNTFDENLAVGYCADNNYLIYSTTSNSYKEAIKTYERFPSCQFNQTRGKIIMQLVDMVCLQSKCRFGVTTDLTNGNTRLLWKNDTALYSP